MVSLEFDIPEKFKPYHLDCYFYIEEDCYRMTLLDEDKNQTMLFIPKLITTQSSKISDYVFKYAKNKYPELFL